MRQVDLPQQAPATGSGPGRAGRTARRRRCPRGSLCGQQRGARQRHSSTCGALSCVCSLAPGAAHSFGQTTTHLPSCTCLIAHQVVAVVAGPSKRSLPWMVSTWLVLQPGRRSPCRPGSWCAITPASRICQAVYEAAACASTDGVGQAGLGGALADRVLTNSAAHRVVGERRMLLEDRHRQRVLRLGQRHQRAGRRVHVEVLRRRVVDLLHRVEQQVAVEADRADPDEVGLGVLHAVGDRAEVAVAEVPFEEQHFRAGRASSAPRARRAT